MKRPLVSVALLLASLSGSAAFSPGPCDVVTCAEAYSVARAMTHTYSGKLFQLYNGSTTLDVGQAANGLADMSTWAAFCSNVPTNCFFSKIYAQVSTGSNDLIPANVASPPVAACSTQYACAAPFTIEAATGLPVVQVNAPYEYVVGAEVQAVGITAGNSSISMIYNGRNIAINQNAGPFGIGHSYTQADTQGTAFYVLMQYSNTGAFNSCSSSTEFCTGIDEESNGDVGNYGTVVQNVISSVTFNSVSNTVTATLDGNLLFTNHPPATTLNYGKYIHFGGGADLLQPADGQMREVLISNAALTAPQQAAVLANMKAFYNCLSFP